MKILHLLQSSRFSGAENVVCQIISMCSNENIDFVYCSSKGQIQEALRERHIKYNLLKEFSLNEIKRVINEERPDIIHAHDMRASFYAALCCGNIPLISHIHNNNFDSRGLSLKSVLYSFAAKKSKHIFWVSQSSFDGYYFHKFLNNKSTILYNIIDIDKLEEKAQLDEKFYNYDLIYLGRITEPKNPRRLLKIFKKVLTIRPKTRIVMIGNGDLSNEIELEIKNDPILNKIDFLGFYNNPYKILKDSKVMIMTSLWEGTPMCALEALALGVPIVSTPTDGLINLIDDGINGFLSKDDNIITEKICLILDNNEIHNQMSMNAKNMSIKMMDKTGYMNELVSIYCKVINERKKV